MFLLSNLLGCIIRLKDNGEVGFKLSQEFAFYHEVSETKAQSEAELDAKPAVDYIIDLRADDDD